MPRTRAGETDGRGACGEQGPHERDRLGGRAPGGAARRDLGGGAWLDLWPGLVEDHERAMDALVNELPFRAETYRIVGREVTSPRLVSWHGDPDTAYDYSGVHHEPAPWTPVLDEMRARVQRVTGLTFNAVLANFYRDGRDGVGWHADAERQIGPSHDDRWIASLSLGSARRFLLRHKKTRESHELSLGGGDLLVMRGTTQRLYRHSVPKTRRPVGPRVNLTFRHMVTS